MNLEEVRTHMDFLALNMRLCVKKPLIYVVECNDAKITDSFVGYTINFYNRKLDLHCEGRKKHVSNKKLQSTVEKNKGWANWTMRAVCVLDDELTKQQQKIEIQKYIELFGANLN